MFTAAYHPKSKTVADSDNTTKHISDTLNSLSRHHSNNFVVGGDFNHFDMRNIRDVYNLTNIVVFLNRQGAYLDHVYTNITDIATSKCNKPDPPGSSDHDTILLPCCKEVTAPTSYSSKWKITLNARINIQCEVAIMDWDDITLLPDVHQQAEARHNKMTACFNKHCHVRIMKIKHSRTTWFNLLATKLKNAKKIAYA